MYRCPARSPSLRLHWRRHSPNSRRRNARSRTRTMTLGIRSSRRRFRAMENLSRTPTWPKTTTAKSSRATSRPDRNGARRGYRPPAPPPDDSIPNFGELIAAQARLARPAFTADNRFVVFSIEPTKAELNKAKKDKKKPEDMPKNALGIMDLSSGQVAKIERVKNFQVPEDAGGFIAYLMEAKPAAPPAKEATPKENSTNPEEELQDEDSAQAPQGARPGRGSKKEYGTDLVVRNTTTGTERTISDVLDYSLSKDAKTLAYTVASKNEETN